MTSMNTKLTKEQVKQANRAAKKYGTTHATIIKLSEDVNVATVTAYDGPHAESKTGIRASLHALSKWPKTYSYVPSMCVVVIPDADEKYNNDDH